MIGQEFFKASEKAANKARDIVVIQISQNGEINWAQKVITRHYYSARSNYYRYVSFIMDNLVYILFNDALYYTTKEELHPVAKFELNVASAIVLWEVDHAGDKKQYILTPEEKNNIKLCPDYCHRLGYNDFQICVIQKNERSNFDLKAK